MDKNDYGYQPNKNTLLAMFDTDLLTYDGKAPTVIGMCTMDMNEHPDKVEASLYTAKQGCLLYNISPIGTSDFTIDFWMRYQSGYSGLSTAVATSVFGIIYNTDVRVSAGISGSGVVMGKEMTYATRWVHYALVRQGKNYYKLVDGKLIAAVNNNENYNLPGNQIAINGRYVNAYYGGPCNYKAVRLCTHARWTSDFTPPVPIPKCGNHLYLKDNAVYGTQ